MNCPACGKQIDDGSMFCGSCGATLRPASPPAAAAPAPFPPPPAAVAAAPAAPTAGALLASLSMGEKISGGGAIAALVGFFLPWVSVANPLLATAAVSYSGIDLAKTSGAVYLVPLFAIVAGALCYFSSKAAAGQKLKIAGWLVLIGAPCGPGYLLALIFVSQLHSLAGIGMWLVALGFTAIATGGMMTIRDFSNRVY